MVSRETVLRLPSANELDPRFPVLSAEMIERLRGYGVERFVPMRTKLFSVGDRASGMFVILTGEIKVYAVDSDGKPKLVAHHRESEFTNELDLITSRHTLVDGITETDCRLIHVSRDELRRLIDSEGDIANIIMQAAVWRRIALVEGLVSGVIVLGEQGNARTIELQDFLTRNSYPFRLLEPVDQQPSEWDCQDPATSFCSLPTVILPDGRHLQRPSLSVLADELGLMEELLPGVIFDTVIVGAGPAGLAAAVYSASEGLSTLVIESYAPGGQAGTSSRIENYLGFPMGVTGLELATRAQVQAQKFGARLAISREVVSLHREAEGTHFITLSDGQAVRARTVVIATGARYRKLDALNYDKYRYQGIHYAATGMEGMLCKGQGVVVVGGGNSAGQAAIFLAGFAKHVHLVIRRSSLEETMSRYLTTRVDTSSRITVHTSAVVDSLHGEPHLENVVILDQQTGQLRTLAARALFVMIGAAPNSTWLRGSVGLDQSGFVMTGHIGAFDNSRYATDVPGVFAVGDIRAESVKRVASAAGEGSVVVSDIHRYLANRSS